MIDTARYFSQTLAARRHRACSIGVIFLLLALWQACGRNPAPDISPRRTSGAASTKQLIIDYLGTIYERPKDNRWEEGRVYFMPDRPGLVQLPTTRRVVIPRNLEVYKASVWFAHWGPEEFVVLVWVVSGEGQPQLGVLSEPAEIPVRFPQALRGLTFDRPEERQSLALLVGEMTAAFYGEKSPNLQALPSELNCEWVGLRASSRNANGRVSCSCFSGRGSLEKVILAKRNWYG